MDFAIIKHRLDAHPSRDFGKGATDADIRRAEVELGIPLRGSYREFLRSFGWGGVGDIELFGLGVDVPHHLNLVTIAKSEREEANPPLRSYLIPVANDGGGNLFCLDVSEPYRDEFPVVFWDHEGGSDQVPDLVAGDFSEWLSERLDQRQ
jgi:hypothetical protein